MIKMASWTPHLAKGDLIPNVLFKMRIRVGKVGQNPFEWKNIYTQDLFKNKRCVLFSLPGAFTPVCSSNHLPGYEKLYEKIKEHNIDEVYCLSVNDAFVMRKWGLDQGLEEDKTIGSLHNFKKVKLIPDGACLFTRGMGMNCSWTTERGFGERSWRYSAVINNMKIEKIFVEQPFKNNSEDDPFKVSDADTMLKYLSSKK
jgi:peroxiredoxin (alkyl hydroperoxide reductase subunit C)